MSLGSQRENFSSESTWTLKASVPSRPAASPSAPFATIVVPGPRAVRSFSCNRPPAIVARTRAESTVRLSSVDDFTSPLTVAFIVAGLKPRPVARAVAVTLVRGARASTAWALNSCAPTARS